MNTRSWLSFLLGLGAASSPWVPALGAQQNTSGKANPWEIKGFTQVPRDWTGGHYRVYKVGSGPAVFLLHEVPGLTEEDITLARSIAGNGFTVFVPLFFGKPCDYHPYWYLFTQCLLPSRFSSSALLAWHTPGVSGWVGRLIPKARQDCGGKGVGIIGMCLTGGLPIALMKEPDVMAAVLCQPTNPFLFHHTIDVSKKDLDIARKRTDVTPLGLRFSGDGKCSEARFETLGHLFPGHFSEIVIDSGAMHCALSHVPHSVLAEDFSASGYTSATQEALVRVVHYLKERLSDSPAGSPSPMPGCPAFFKSCKDY